MRNLPTSADDLVLWLNGDWIRESQAKISIFDDGFLRADAAFDAARTFNGLPFQLEEHVDRLLESCRFLQLDVSLNRNQLLQLGYEVAERNLCHIKKYGDFWIDYHVTRGVTRPGYPAGLSVMVYCDPIPFRERAALFRDGIPIVVSSIRRTPPWAVSPRVKTHNYLNFVIARLAAKSSKAAWPILLDENGNLAEGNSSNIFLIKEGALFTPLERYVLPGISRKNVMGLARELNIPVKETDLDLRDLYTADEVFLTSTSLCLCRVGRIDGKLLKGTVPGPITGQLTQAYAKLVGMDIHGQYLSFLAQN